MGARLWYLSWPAVSQISNLTVVSSRQTVWVRKAAPMVLSWYSWNWPLTKRSTRLDLPTADSPRSTSLNWQIFPWVAPFGRWAAPAEVEAGPGWPPRFAMTLAAKLQNKNKQRWVSGKYFQVLKEAPSLHLQGFLSHPTMTYKTCQKE